jgi:serine/threonine protein kinase
MEGQNWLGRSLNGRYKIEALLGQGGMSAVYKAHDPSLQRAVAVKLIHSHLSLNEDFVWRFKKEAAVVAAFHHPNIVKVFDFNTEGDLHYMVLEYIAGQSVQERLKDFRNKNARMPINQALQIVIEICDALAYAHRHGTIHRDIKPANIMLNPQGRAVLMDFGIVKIVGSTTHTAAGAVVGTARYMSPEIIRGEPLDQRSDLYSLGVTLFEMVSGQPPFDARTAIALLERHIREPAPDIRDFRPDAPAGLSRIIYKAMEKEREVRYRSAVEMATDLRELLDGLGPAPVSVPDFSPRVEFAPPPAPIPVSPGSSTEQWTDAAPQGLSFLGGMTTTDEPSHSDKTLISSGIPPATAIHLAGKTLLSPGVPAADKTLLAGGISFDGKALSAAHPSRKVEPISEPVKPVRPAGSPAAKYIVAGLALLLLLFIFLLLVVIGGWFVFQIFFPFS